MLNKLSMTGFSMKPNSILSNVFNFGDRSKSSAAANVSSMFSDENISDTINIGTGPKKNRAEDLGRLDHLS